jgi:hypothetical protein
MSDPGDLKAKLQQLARHLDDRSTAVEPEVVMQRTFSAPPPRRRAVLRIAGVAAAVAALAGVALLVPRLDGTDERQVETLNDPTVTLPSPTTTLPDAAATWPASGIAVTENGRLVLLDYEGGLVAEAPTPVVDRLATADAGLDTVVVVSATEFTLAPASAQGSESPPDCEPPVGTELRITLCGGGATHSRERVVRIDASGATTVLADKVGLVGHWRWALPSPDGRWVLAQWSAECESPQAYLIPADGSLPRLLVDESTGVGWSPDGKAILRLRGGSCGEGSEQPGTYVVDPASGERTILRPESDPLSQTFLWLRLQSRGP